MKKKEPPTDWALAMCAEGDANRERSPKRLRRIRKPTTTEPAEPEEAASDE